MGCSASQEEVDDIPESAEFFRRQHQSQNVCYGEWLEGTAIMLSCRLHVQSEVLSSLQDKR